MGNILRMIKNCLHSAMRKRSKEVVPEETGNDEETIPKIEVLDEENNNDEKENKTITKIYSSSSNQLPPASTWKHESMYFHADPSVVTLPDQNKCTGQECPIGIPFDFESDLFKGQAMIRVRDLKSSCDVNSDKKYFHGRKRKNQIIVQGKFKEEIKCVDAISGTEFKECFATQPPKFLETLLHKIFRRISPSLDISLCGDKPKVMVNLGEAAQTISVDDDGEQPDIRSIKLQEKGFADSLSKRKKVFTSLHKTDSDVVYDTKRVYTIELYYDSFDYKTYYMILAPFLKFDMVKATGKQPFQVMARTKSDERYLWVFTMFHSGHCTN